MTTESASPPPVLQDGPKAATERGGRAQTPAVVKLIAEAPMRLGPLVIDPPQRRLVHDDGREDVLEPRVMQVLVALARTPGAILSREDLMACCWEGRIVGDDALNRVMSRLRRVSYEIGAGSLRLETITKVGFRLVRVDTPNSTVPARAPTAHSFQAPSQAVSQTDVVIVPDAAADSPVPILPVLPASGLIGIMQRWRGSGSRPMVLAVAIAGSLALVTGVGLTVALRRSAATKSSVPELELATFHNVTPAAAPGAEQTLREELVAAFGRSSTIRLLSDGRMSSAAARSFRLDGSVQRLAAGLRFAFTLVRGGPGAVIWSDVVDRPTTDGGLASRQIAAQVSFTVRCILLADADHTGSLPDAALSDYAKACAEIGSSESGEAVSRMTENLRQAVAKAPDFAAGWGMLGYVIADRFAYPAALWDAGDRTEAAQAVEHALRLDPKSSPAHLAKGLLTPWRSYADRETEFGLAMQEPDPFGSAHAADARFLLSVGRVKDAAFAAERGYDLDPDDREVIDRLVQAFYTLGHVPEADKLVAMADASWSDSPKLTMYELWAAIWDGHHQAAIDSLRTGRYEEAVRTVGPDAGSASPIAAAAIAVFEALDSGQAQERATAAQTIASLAADPRSIDPFDPLALAALGRDQAALAADERVVKEWSTSLTFLLFTPPFASARRTPQFTALVDRMGLLSYWRMSGHAPDFCSEADPPPVCRSLH